MLICGVGLLGAAWLPAMLKNKPLSLTMCCLAIGLIGSLVPWAPEIVRALQDITLIEKFSELCVLVSLAGAGFSLDRPLTWKMWLLPRRLLLVTMPLTILGVMALAVGVLDVSWASALLLGAVLAPTDPVLASDVQVEGPNTGTEDDIRFALTSEASLNDGLAFPFTAAAIAWGTHGALSQDWVLQWAAYDLIYRVVVGVLAGILIGKAIAKITFDCLQPRTLTHVTAAMLVVGLTCITYVLTEYVHGYGFLAVFIAAAVVRRHHKNHEMGRLTIWPLSLSMS